MARQGFYEVLGNWLDKLEERNVVTFWIITASGIVGTVALWYLRYKMGRPLLAKRATTPQFIVYFLPPFFAAFCLGRIWLRKQRSGEETASEIMQSYAYMNNSNREYKLLLGAIIIGVANYMAIFLAK